MEQFDGNMEQRVWQRVRGGSAEQPERMDLRALMLSAMENAAAYRQLSGMLTGRLRERAKGLLEGEQANIACLKGIHLLSTGAAMKPKAMNLPSAPAGKLLEKCFHRSRRAMVEYTSRTVDGEFGAVFQKMADREREHGAVIAELLGELGR